MTLRIDGISNINPVGANVEANSDDTPVLSGIADRSKIRNLTFLIITGILADADATFEVTMEHGDDPALADGTAVTDDETVGGFVNAAFDFSDDNSARKIGYKGPRRYVQLTVTPTGNTGLAPIGVVAIQGAPGNSPAANPPA